LLSDDLKNKLYYDGFQKNAVSLLAPKSFKLWLEALFLCLGF